MRRVEPKIDGMGRGMATDPERILELQEQAARSERANRPKPKVPFKKIMREKEQEASK